MGFDYIDEKKFKRLVKQISGTITERDGELVPYHSIIGSGAMWCYQPSNKTMVRVLRGTKIFVLDYGDETDERCLALTTDGVPILIKKDEIIEIGFD